MPQSTQQAVLEQLEPYHSRIWSVIVAGHHEWLAVNKFRIDAGFGSVLYPRTEANYIFDAVVRNALAEFSDDKNVRVIVEPQTLKFCFGEVVLARFKKGSEERLGQNQMTQAVMNFITQDAELPGLPPAAAKVEILYSSTDIGDEIEKIVIAARDNESLLWHYELEGAANDDGVLPFPAADSANNDDDEDTTPIVIVRKSKDDNADNEG